MDTPAASIEFIFILFLIVANGFFVLTETAISEAHKVKLEKQADAGKQKALLALSLVEEPSKILAAIQIGITLSVLLIGTITGARLTPLLAKYFDFLPFEAGYSNFVVLFCSGIMVMYLVIVIGELVPKKIALEDPEAILIRYAKLLSILEKTTKPFVFFLEQSTNVLLLFLGINPAKENTVTEDEVRTLIEQGTEEGTFDKTEQDMVDKVFRLGDQNAYALMTPRTQMLWIDLEDTLEHNLTLIRENPDTVFPVGRDSLDNLVGILYAKDLLNVLLSNREINLEDCIRTPMFIPKSMHSFSILENFKESGIHEAVVLDEFGGVIGFLTMQDIISEVVGDISPKEEEPKQIIKRDDTSWLIDGLLPIDEFKKQFEIEQLPDEEKDHYQTMGGFITSFLGYIPVKGEKFVWNDFSFEIVDMDRVRIDKFLVAKLNIKKVDDESIAS